MISAENSELDNSQMQQPLFKFTFIIQSNKLIIEATCLKDDKKYDGEVIANPYIDFQIIKQLIESGEYKTLIKTDDLLKIRIGATIVELVPKQKYQMKDLIVKVKSSLQRQSQLQKIIQSQNIKIEQHNQLIQDLTKKFQEIKPNCPLSGNTDQSVVKQFGYKINQLRQEIKKQINSVDNKLSQKYYKFQEQQKKFQQVFNEVNTMKGIGDVVLKQFNDLKAGERKNQESFNNLKRFIDDEFRRNKSTLDTFENRFEHIRKMERKVDGFETMVDRRLMNLRDDLQSEKKFNRMSEYKKQKKSNQMSYLSKSYRWSQILKSKSCVINGNILKSSINKWDHFTRFALLDVGFTQDLQEKQSWGIRILNHGNDPQLYIGIGLKKTVKDAIQSEYFNFHQYKYNSLQKGFYLMNSKGQYFSHPKQSYDTDNKGFKFQKGDVIFMEYDPIELKLIFMLNGRKFVMSIVQPLDFGAYHPCFGLQHEGKQEISVELIYPGRSLS